MPGTTSKSIMYHKFSAVTPEKMFVGTVGKKFHWLLVNQKLLQLLFICVCEQSGVCSCPVVQRSVESQLRFC